MWIILLWVALSILAGVIASNKGRGFGGVVLVSLILSPLVGIIWALAMQPNQKQLEATKLGNGEHRKCPYCAELVKSEAAVCRFCGKDLPAMEPAA